LRFFLLRSKKKTPNASAISTAIPPIVPPTIAPTGVGFEVWVGGGALEDVDVNVTGVGLGEELDEGVGVVEKETDAIVKLTKTKEPADAEVPASVAVAYIVSMDGTESQ
jgi:hypothetical protein